jgi:hypothetical protein
MERGAWSRPVVERHVLAAKMTNVGMTNTNCRGFFGVRHSRIRHSALLKVPLGSRHLLEKHVKTVPAGVKLR